MENKILRAILNIIKNSKTLSSSYYHIKRKLVKLDINISLNKYLNYLIKKKCIYKKKNKYFYF